MARYALNLPTALKQEAASLAKWQGVSLNQFILWSVSDRVGALRQSLNDVNSSPITYRRGESGIPTPVLSGTGIRVQTIVTCIESWEMSPEEVADEYDLSLGQVKAALYFYKTHQDEIDSHIAYEHQLAAEAGYV